MSAHTGLDFPETIDLIARDPHAAGARSIASLEDGVRKLYRGRPKLRKIALGFLNRMR